MGYVHIAHDCQVGSHTIFANLAHPRRHVHVAGHAILGGFTGAHQFVSVGAHSMTGVATVLLQDLPPFVMAQGNTPSRSASTAKGSSAAGFSAEKIAAIKRAYKTLYRSGLALEEARVRIGAQVAECPELQLPARFSRAVAPRGHPLASVTRDRIVVGDGGRRGLGDFLGANLIRPSAKRCRRPFSSASGGRRCEAAGSSRGTRWRGSPVREIRSTVLRHLPRAAPRASPRRRRLLAARPRLSSGRRAGLQRCP